MSLGRRLSFLMGLSLLLLGSDCSRRPEDFDSCPSGLVRTFVDGTPACACNADTDGNGIISEEEFVSRQVIASSDVLSRGCSSDDWVVEDGVFFVGGQLIPAPQLCEVVGDERDFLGNGSLQCVSCDCSGPCIPSACETTCAETRSCPSGEYCGREATCAQCGSNRECGAGCGACADGSICIDGRCSGLVRCSINPTGFCSERAPTWCPLPAFENRRGARCFCDLSFQCGSAGLFRTVYSGFVE